MKLGLFTKLVNRHPLVSSMMTGAAVIALATTPAIAAGAVFVQHQSRHDFSATVSVLQKSIADNGMMVMGRVNQAKVLSMTGLRLAGAQSFLVGNPTVGKKLFGMNPAVGAVLPLRVYVWQNGGRVYVGYFEPSDLLAGISSMLSMPGQMLDKKFAMILKEATE